MKTKIVTLALAAAFLVGCAGQGSAQQGTGNTNFHERRKEIKKQRQGSCCQVGKTAVQEKTKEAPASVAVQEVVKSALKENKSKDKAEKEVAKAKEKAE